MPRRKLTLRSENLGDLTADQLTSVAGGAATYPTCPTLPLIQCVTRALHCMIYDPDSIVCNASRAVESCIQC